MKSWFEGLEPREQLFIGVGGVLVIVALLYALVWVPLDARHQNARSAVATWERALAELKPLRGICSCQRRARSPGLRESGPSRRQW